MTETVSVVIKAVVAEIGADRITVHPKDDPTQTITVSLNDVLAYGEGCKRTDKETKK